MPPKPPAKVQPGQIGPHLHGLRTDEDYNSFLNRTQVGEPAVRRLGWIKVRLQNVPKCFVSWWRKVTGGGIHPINIWVMAVSV